MRLARTRLDGYGDDELSRSVQPRQRRDNSLSTVVMNLSVVGLIGNMTGWMGAGTRGVMLC